MQTSCSEKGPRLFDIEACPLRRLMKEGCLCCFGVCRIPNLRGDVFKTSRPCGKATHGQDLYEHHIFCGSRLRCNNLFELPHVAEMLEGVVNFDPLQSSHYVCVHETPYSDIR